MSLAAGFLLIVGGLLIGAGLSRFDILAMVSGAALVITGWRI